MTAGDDQQRPDRFWKYPGSWMRQEKFYFDVFTRTVSALIAALIVFLTAKTAGFLTEVSWADVGRVVLTGSAWTGLISGLLAVLGMTLSIRGYVQDRRDAAEHQRKLAAWRRAHQRDGGQVPPADEDHNDRPNQ